MKPRPIIILGAGGHAKVLLEILRCQRRDVIGAATGESDGKGSVFCEVPVLGGDEILDDFAPGEVELVNAIGFVKQSSRRVRAFERAKSKGFLFATLVHPSAVVSSDIRLGEGVQIMAGAVVQPGTFLGDDSIINTCASVDHDCHIGAHVHVAPGATLCGNVSIGDASLVGAGATVIQGVRIGRNCIVGAGTLLRKDVADELVVVGASAQPVSRKDV